jgi:hypothetical protein
MAAGNRQTLRYVDSYLETVVNNCQDDGYKSAMAYEAQLQTDIEMGLIDISDPRVYTKPFSSHER